MAFISESIAGRDGVMDSGSKRSLSWDAQRRLTMSLHCLTMWLFKLVSGESKRARRPTRAEPRRRSRRSYD